MLAELLRLEGHDTRVSGDGISALAIAAQFKPHVALLDLALPQMDGCELALCLRNLAGLTQLALIALSGHSLEAVRDRATDVGFADYFIKPLFPAQFAQLLARIAEAPTSLDQASN